MKNQKLIEFKTNDGAIITIEGIASENDRQLVSAATNEPERSERSFNEIINLAPKAAELILNSFKEINTPDEIELEFGLKFSAKAGVIIAAAGNEASFKVNLIWKKP